MTLNIKKIEAALPWVHTSQAPNNNDIIDLSKATFETRLELSKHISVQISKSFVLNFGAGHIDLSKTSVYLLMRISLYADMDFKITKSLKGIRKESQLRADLYNNAINELIHKGYIIKNQSDLYVTTKSHILIKPKNQEEVKSALYIPHYSFLSDITTYSMSLNAIRSMFFFLGNMSKYGYTGNLTRLYKNKLVKKDIKYGRMLYNRNISSVLNSLNALVKHNIIDFTIRDLANDTSIDTRQLDNEDTCKLDANMILTKFDIAQTRVDVNKIDKLKSVVYLKSDAARNINLSSVAEIQDVFDTNGLDYFEIFANNEGVFVVENNDSNKFIALKNQLFSLLDTAGLALYRDCLNNFVAANQTEMRIWVQTNKCFSIFKDFYINVALQALILRNLEDLAPKQQDFINLEYNGHTYGMSCTAFNDSIMYFAKSSNINRLVSFINGWETNMKQYPHSSERISSTYETCYPSLKYVREIYTYKTKKLYEQTVVQTSADISFQVFETLLPQILEATGSTEETIVNTYLRNINADASRRIATQNIIDSVDEYQASVTSQMSEFMINLLTKAGAKGVLTQYTDETVTIVNDFFTDLLNIDVSHKKAAITTHQKSIKIEELRLKMVREIQKLAILTTNDLL